MTIVNPHIKTIGFSTTNAEATSDFLEGSLGFKRKESFLIDGGQYIDLVGLPGSKLKIVRLALGEETLELTEVVSLGPGQRKGHKPPADSSSCDLWFQHICIVVNDLNAVTEKLFNGIETGYLGKVSDQPQTLPAWNTAAAGIKAFKFRDPEGHNLELLQFPEDKGDARWHKPSAQNILGIDHSAISVSNTAISARFYDELLNLKLGGDGVNSGPTQDGLDGLLGTEVRITGHRCNSGAGIECLNYLPPNIGRKMPEELGIQDIFHWQIRLAVNDLEYIANHIQEFGGKILSNGIVRLSEDSKLFSSNRALQVEDPDGHRLQLVEAEG